jgi:hypothetical protein
VVRARLLSRRSRHVESWPRRFCNKRNVVGDMRAGLAACFECTRGLSKQYSLLLHLQACDAQHNAAQRTLAALEKSFSFPSNKRRHPQAFSRRVVVRNRFVEKRRWTASLLKGDEKGRERRWLSSLMTLRRRCLTDEITPADPRPHGVPSASDPELSRFEASKPGDINGHTDCTIPTLCRHGRGYETCLDESMVYYPRRLLFDCDIMTTNPLARGLPRTARIDIR